MNVEDQINAYIYSQPTNNHQIRTYEDRGKRIKGTNRQDQKE